MSVHKNLVKTWRDSATLIVAARNPLVRNKFKILMLKRSAKSKFMPSSYVYPGGVTSSTDFSDEWSHILKLKNDHFLTSQNKECQRPFDYCINHDKTNLDLAFRICSLRETFEESGLLLVRDENGCKVMLSHPDAHIGGEHSTLGQWREQVNKNEDKFLELFRTVPLTPDVSSLLEWSMWLTPNFRSKRFFTMFYICFVDNILNQSNDNAEIVDSDWLDPHDALAAHYRSEIILQPPQVYESCRLKSYPTFEELENFAREREKLGVEMWCPFKIMCNNGYLVTYPGDDLHDNNPNKEFPKMDCSIEDLRSTNLNRFEDFQDSPSKPVLYCNVDWYGHPAFGVEKSDIDSKL